MPKNLSDSASYTANIECPVDGDPANAASVETGLQGLANRTSYLKGIIDPSPAPTRRRIFAPKGMEGLALWERVSFDIVQVQSNANAAHIVLDLSARFPVGTIITGIEAMVTPGAARLTNSKMFTSLFVQPIDFDLDTFGSETAVGSVVTSDPNWDDGTATRQILAETMSHTLTADNITIMSVRSGVDGGGHVADTLHGVRITFSDIGPRNY